MLGLKEIVIITVVERCGSTVLNAFQSRHLEVNKNYIRPRAKRAKSLAYSEVFPPPPPAKLSFRRGHTVWPC